MWCRIGNNNILRCDIVSRLKYMHKNRGMKKYNMKMDIESRVLWKV